jgi:hypothetical protein
LEPSHQWITAFVLLRQVRAKLSDTEKLAPCVTPLIEPVGVHFAQGRVIWIGKDGTEESVARIHVQDPSAAER